MDRYVPNSGGNDRASFWKVFGAFLSGGGLPFAEILSAERIQRVFAKHDGLFGTHGVYTTPITLWSFLSQVLRDGKQAACQAAVARATCYCRQKQIPSPAADTGSYCRASEASRGGAARIELRSGGRGGNGRSGRLALEGQTCQADRRLYVYHARHAEEYTREEIAELYGFRWNSELDIRSIKDSLNLGHVRCKSPEMVRRELWTTILGYNLIRLTAMTAAALHDKQPRRISFTSTCQYVLAAWMPISLDLIRGSDFHHFCLVMPRLIADCEVGNRPGRLEPRVLKRRRHGYKLMRKPREILRAELRKHCT